MFNTVYSHLTFEVLYVHFYYTNMSEFYLQSGCSTGNQNFFHFRERFCHLICSQDSMAVVPPPNTQTVKKTMRSVVVNIIWRAYVAVSRIAKANAIAPRRPAKGTITK